jgi:FMN reductase
MATSLPVRIVGLGGGLREGSYSLAGLRLALAAAEAAGAETRLLDLNQLPLPLYRPDLKSPRDYGPEAAAPIERLLAGARWAGGLLWASPSYHGSLSGAVKNALDFLQFLAKDDPTFLYGKVVGAIGAGAGTIGAVNVVAQLTQIAQALRAVPVPLLVPITAAHKQFADGKLIDAQTSQRLATLGKETVDIARSLLAARDDEPRALPAAAGAVAAAGGVGVD